MGRGGRRRNTAKTGDKGIYKAREEENEPKADESDNDNVYGKVDRFHNELDEDFIQMDAPEKDTDSEPNDEEEAVMDLGVGASSDDNDSSSSDDDDDNDDENSQGVFEEQEAVSSSDSEEDDYEIGDARSWGKKKANYYRGDTADLEIGQDEEDAVVEEEAAKEVVAARYKDMDEEDFVLSGDEESQDGDDKESIVATSRDISKLSSKQKSKLLEKQHPELLPVLSHFADVAQDLETRTLVCTEAMFEGEEGTPEKSDAKLSVLDRLILRVYRLPWKNSLDGARHSYALQQAVGATQLGQEYLLTKTLLQSTATLNLAMYLLLKSEMDQSQSSELIQSHPVMAHLHKFNNLLDKYSSIEEQNGSLDDQMNNLVKASTLLKTGVVDDESDSEDSNSDDSRMQQDELNPNSEDMDEDVTATKSALVEHQSDENSNASVEQLKQTMNEARFGLRPTEIGNGGSKQPGRTRRPVDFGDADEGENMAARKALASTLNAIEQKASRKRRTADVEMLDEPNIDNHELRKGIEMMEAELGKEDDGAGSSQDQSFHDLGEADDFYDQVKKRSKDKKEARKSKYAVKPKYPRLEAEIEGERAISRIILKNRGLVAHKSKLNRNPRVKKREQYRKRQIQRKGAVREVRTDEGHKYAGETTGIKTGLSRSRNLHR